MKKIFALLSLSVLLVAACDKIELGENGTYSVFAGSNATWTDGTTIENPVQRAYVEKYTGPRCTNCPDADRTLDAAHEQFSSQLVIVSVNSKTELGQTLPSEPDMCTEDGSVWESSWNIPNLPAAFINRTNTDNPYTGAMSNIVADIQQAIDQQPVVALKASVSGDIDVAIDINLQFLQDYTDPVVLSLILIQDSLAYFQIDGSDFVTDYIHNHMLRDVITDAWGADIECTGAAGESRKATFHYTLPENVRENWHIVALVSDKATRRVLNSAECE